MSINLCDKETIKWMIEWRVCIESNRIESNRVATIQKRKAKRSTFLVVLYIFFYSVIAFSLNTTEREKKKNEERNHYIDSIRFDFNSKMDCIHCNLLIVVNMEKDRKKNMKNINDWQSKETIEMDRYTCTCIQISGMDLSNCGVILCICIIGGTPWAYSSG